MKPKDVAILPPGGAGARLQAASHVACLRAPASMLADAAAAQVSSDEIEELQMVDGAAIKG